MPQVNVRLDDPLYGALRQLHGQCAAERVAFGELGHYSWNAFVHDVLARGLREVMHEQARGRAYGVSGSVAERAAGVVRRWTPRRVAGLTPEQAIAALDGDDLTRDEVLRLQRRAQQG